MKIHITIILILFFLVTKMMTHKYYRTTFYETPMCYIEFDEDDQTEFNLFFLNGINDLTPRFLITDSHLEKVLEELRKHKEELS